MQLSYRPIEKSSRADPYFSSDFRSMTCLAFSVEDKRDSLPFYVLFKKQVHLWVHKVRLRSMTRSDGGVGLTHILLGYNGSTP